MMPTQQVGTRPGLNDYEKAIIPNKQLENQLDIYKKVRSDLRSSLVRLDVLEKEHKNILSATRRAKDSNVADEGGNVKNDWNSAQESYGGDCVVRPRKRTRGRAEEDAASGSSTHLNRRETNSPKRACRRVAEKPIDTTNDDSETDEVDDVNDLPFIIDDQHTFKETSCSVTQYPPRRKLQRKPIITYHKMKKKQLMDLCRKEGLSSQGNEQELKDRHSEFITLCNSECDSEHPRTVKELTMEIKKREKARKVCPCVLPFLC